MSDFNQVLDFWFEEITPASWWTKDPSFDEVVRQRFMTLHHKATRGELDAWRDHPEGALAEVIVLDQFSRNMFRGSLESFRWDPLALALAQSAIRLGYDEKLSQQRRLFLYMPFMHSESPEIHQVALKLFEQPDLKDNLEFELQHKRIIDRFGRYPHRNAILRRESTPEEIAFLLEDRSSF
jgi:uncharacterized protein (DUF924 family)